MAIPYKINSFLEGRIQIKSDFFKYIHISQKAIEDYFKNHFKGIKKIKVSKKTGRITIEYNPDIFDVKEFFYFLNTASPETILEMLSEAENGYTKPQGEEGSAKKWFALNTLVFGMYLIRVPIPQNIMAGITIALAVPVFKKALNSLRHKKIDVHLLDSSAIALSTIQENPLSSMLMVWLLSLGDLIEEKTQGTAHKAIEELLNYKDEEAWLVTNGTAIKVPVEKVKKGDKVVVYTGEKITVDGVVVDGEALVNQASLTGESNPVLKKKGDKVYAGTFVEDGKLYITAEKVGDETALAKIVHIIEESAKQPIETQKRAEEVANKAVIPTLLTAGIVYASTNDLNRATSTLIVDYHTGVHVAVPTSVMAHMTLAAKKGILFKSGRHLELMHKVDTIVFDKTGTLTVGHPEITEIVPYKVSEEQLLQIAASLEQRLTHPVAKSIVYHAIERGLNLLPRENSKYHMGLGVEAEINGEKYLIGSTKFMERMGIKIPKKIIQDRERMHEDGESVLYIVKGKTILGLIGFTDPPRPEAKKVVQMLHDMGREVILCTGDNEGAAALIAKKLGIKRYYARAFPDEKARIIKELKKEGRIVAFLGDGVNDSPALSVADIGISIRSGADIAIEVADVVINNDLCNLIEAFKLSDLALENIEQNIKMNAVANTIGILGAILGVITPVGATIINNGTTVLLGINALKPLWKKEFKEFRQLKEACKI